jgi:hypothetical protein
MKSGEWFKVDENYEELKGFFTDWIARVVDELNKIESENK